MTPAARMIADALSLPIVQHRTIAEAFEPLLQSPAVRACSHVVELLENRLAEAKLDAAAATLAAVWLTDHGVARAADLDGLNLDPTEAEIGAAIELLAAYLPLLEAS